MSASVKWPGLCPWCALSAERERADHLAEENRCLIELQRCECSADEACRFIREREAYRHAGMELYQRHEAIDEELALAQIDADAAAIFEAANGSTTQETQ